MQWLCVLLYTLIYNFGFIKCKCICICSYGGFYMMLMYMNLFLWCLLYSINVYVFIPMALFIIKNYQI